MFVFGIPDSQKSLKQGDVAMLWEEHPIYFTKKNFIRAFQIFGYKILSCKRYLYPQEDALAFRIKQQDKRKMNKIKNLNTDLSIGELFVKKYKIKRKKLISFLKKRQIKEKNRYIWCRS